MSGALGLDGAAGGWVGWLIEDEHVQALSFNDDAQLLEILPVVELSFIDIPIGLADLDHHRRCDELLRKRLKTRKSSVFPCPTRAAVYAENYMQACDLNVEISGKKLSKQSWNICDKIRQIDTLLQNNSGFHLKESHPEFLFQYLNDDKPLHSSKKTMEGYLERMEIIRRYHPSLHSTLSRAQPGGLGKMDDWVDAAILAIAASLALKSGLMTIPEKPTADGKGITMAIHLPNLAATV